MGGMESPLFSKFVTLFCCGFLALQAHVDTFATIVEITCRGSSFKCFDGREADEVVSKLRERFASELGKEASVAHALDLIKQATNQVLLNATVRLFPVPLSGHCCLDN
jgi:phosphatidylinositol 4-kinase